MILDDHRLQALSLTTDWMQHLRENGCEVWLELDSTEATLNVAVEGTLPIEELSEIEDWGENELVSIVSRPEHNVCSVQLDSAIQCLLYRHLCNQPEYSNRSGTEPASSRS